VTLGRVPERAGGAADFEAVGLEGHRLPPEVETTVYRLVQEALNNVAKHAGARRASGMVAQHGGELIALIEDDGRGFDAAHTEGHFGLLGMRERARLLGGSLGIASASGRGTRVVLTLPLEG